MNEKHNGTDYCAEFLFLIYDNVNIEPFTTKGYDLVGKRFNVTRSAVIKEMQYAIEFLFLKTTQTDLLYTIFGNTVSEESGRPSNKQFIYTLKDYFDFRI